VILKPPAPHYRLSIQDDLIMAIHVALNHARITATIG